VVDYFSTVQPELRPHMRRIVTDWMLEVCEDQEAGPEVFLLAVHYLDSFLSTTTIRKSQFQLAAATCLLLASKFSSVVPLSALQLVLYTDHSVTVAELLEWELEVLGALGWQLAAPTAHSFLEQAAARLQQLGALEPAQVAGLHRHARTLATLAATEHAFLLVPASELAGAALAAAYRGLGLAAAPGLVDRLASLLRCPPARLLRWAAALDSLVAAARPPVAPGPPGPPGPPTLAGCSKGPARGGGSATPTDCHLVTV
jgi:cyclin D2